MPLRGPQKSAMPFYTRASFAVSLRIAGENVDANWDHVPLHIVQHNNHNIDKLSISDVFEHELHVYLHIIELQRVDIR